MINVEELNRLPTGTGIYLMKGEDEKVLYVGKANNLRQRVKQYFGGRDERLTVPFLLRDTHSVDFILVTSEKEALILENNLIKKHQPKYNALLKDDKTYFSIMINHKHLWPMVRLVRFKGHPPKGALYFGPYTKAYAAKQTLELLRTLFPLRQCSDSELVNRSRPCILYDLKRCIAPCVAKCTKESYDLLVEKTIKFLRGHSEEIVKELHEEMKRASERLEFEKAQLIHQRILYIETTLEKQRVEKAGLADLDVLGIYREGEEVVLIQMLFREGKLSGSCDYHFSHNAQENEELITSFLLQHYEEKEVTPDQILLPFALKEAKSLEELLSITIEAPQRGDKRALIEMAQKNAEAHFLKRREKSDLMTKILISLEEECHLINFPEKIECFDTSHMGGEEMVSSMVVFVNGEKEGKSYRKYKIRISDPADDYGALKEVLQRRYSRAKEEDNLPDLIMIDGGRGHLNIAIKVLSDLDISTVDVIALSKEEGKHTRGITLEKIHMTHTDIPLTLPSHSSLLHFLQRIRDEAHRTALSFQKKRMTKKRLTSALDEIPGIGPIKKKRLLNHFGGIQKIKEATVEELLAVKGITQKDVDALKNQL